MVREVIEPEGVAGNGEVPHEEDTTRSREAVSAETATMETDHRHAVEATGHQAKDGSAARMDGAGRQPTTMVAKSVTKKQIG